MCFKKFFFLSSTWLNKLIVTDATKFSAAEVVESNLKNKVQVCLLSIELLHFVQKNY